MLLALSATSAFGAPIYITDPTAPVQITYQFAEADYTHQLFVMVLDVDGRLIFNQNIFNQNGPNNRPVGQTYTLNSLPDAYSIVLGIIVWDYSGYRDTYYSDDARNADRRDHAHVFDGYSDGQVRVAWEDWWNLGDGAGNNPGAKDWNDAILSLTNVSLTAPQPPLPPPPPPPPQDVPEPGTLALLLGVGGLAAAVMRRRRNS